MEEKGTLVVTSPTEIKKDLALADPSKLALPTDTEKDLDTRAAEFVNQLIAAKEEAGKTSVETMGVEIQKKAAQQSALLNQPIHMLSQRGQDGGDVANALINLKVKVEEIDPGKFDFEPGWLSRTLGRLPGVGTPIKRYFSKYESAQTVIAAVVRSLEQGRDQLLRDNVTLIEDQKAMREMTHKLERAVRLGQLIDQKIQYKLDREFPPSDPKHKFIAEELQFPLRQRIIDLQQQLAVNQQGVLATEIIIRNNKELARGVDRALNVTVSALRVGATVAMALANQKITLDKLDAVSKTTSDLIAGTAERLKTQGVEIQKRASSTQLDMGALKAAFADIETAIQDLSNFRMQALPQMASTVLELDKISASAEATIKRIESGHKSAPEIKLEIE